MTTRNIAAALLGAAAISFTACKGGGDFKKIKGVEYKIVKDAEGKNAVIGEIVEVNLVAKVDTETIGNTWKEGRPALLRLDSAKSGDWQAVLPFMSAGDSAIVVISCDTILKNIPQDQMGHLPPWLKKGNKITVNMSVASIKSEEAYRKESEAKQAEQMKKMEEEKERLKPMDEATLQEYFTKNGIKPQKSASGLYYVIQKQGSGANIQKGQEVAMKYTGKLLDGTPFDSNVDTAIGHHGTELLRFNVGQHMMIPGVDEGVEYLKKGTKATLYLPSGLAYGPNSPSPKIPANAIMVFDVEIMEVKAPSAK